MNARWIMAIAWLAVFVSGCTPIGQIKESEYIWQEQQLSMSYQQAYRNIRDAFRSCTDEYAEATMFDDIKTGEFDVYIPGMFNVGKSPTVLGRILAKEIGPGVTSVRAGVIDAFDGPGLFGTKGARRARWLRWATGDLNCET
ncbi:MAG: hypothetical protein A3H93_18130 [Rhodocyclales bacterium RIFCSPLOWO2_02_FULL_63_24]|nr:MAG: hypothetical protein A3H93_18130 [Rhodocyclales bacterium RIFCSPLOWO2_02_FULL_63_24]